MAERENESTEMTAKSILEVCKDTIPEILKTSMIEGYELPVTQPTVWHKKLCVDELKLRPHIVKYNSETSLTYSALMKLCLSSPVTVINGLTNLVKIDLSLFSSEGLVKSNPNYEIEILTQVKQEIAAINKHPLFGCKHWNACCRQFQSTIVNYAEYQKATFAAQIEELRQNIHNVEPSSSSAPQEHFIPPDMIEFGARIDLSDRRYWNRHLTELQKLPEFLSTGTPSNLLYHLDHPIPGMTTVAASMRIPGCRITGRQQNNNFCTVDINIGVGTCVWFVVSVDYWEVIEKLCDKHSISFAMGTWWPILDELFEANVPVYHVVQGPGDIVYINYGSVYWMHSISWSTGVSWAVGPMTPQQYFHALNRYEWNRFNNYKSVVPMHRLTWNLAKKIKFTDKYLFCLIKRCLLRMLLVSYQIDELAKEKNFTVINRTRRKYPVVYCRHCKVELFNFIFVFADGSSYDILCVDCTKKFHSNFSCIICYQYYKMEELIDCFDKFKLYKPVCS